MTRVEIPLSKKKNLLLLLGAIVFVAMGVWFVFKPVNFVSPFHQSIALIRIVGLLSVVFFGACTIYGFIKLFDKKPGLVIDENGITDNTNGTSIGLINWEDISSIEAKQVMSSKFLLVLVKDPDKYVDRTTGFKRKMLQANLRMYGTPLSIISTSLTCNFDELKKLVTSNLHEFQKVES